VGTIHKTVKVSTRLADEARPIARFTFLSDFTYNCTLV